ncbi:dTDP-4-dehydrorhamnose reductase [Shimia ponticola]|uniref:dTDP-4-dehydrorhamnose reductase n=1 Tax=Shimia ponticola TaxID=2582893 RepID=UPI0011BF89F1|nr:dTDP-4-dehydrorhamnose reductase [Shimia ponticola]
MRVLVFGATGQVGNALSKHDNVVALNRAEADLTNPQGCARLIERAEVDAVINAAAMTAVDRAETHTGEAFVVNARAPAAMAMACTKKRIPLVHLSTDYVFDGSGRGHWRPEDTPSPIQVYGRSKLAGEDTVRASGGVHAILRTSWVFSGRIGNFVSTILRAARARPQLSVVDDQIGAPTPADALARAAMTVATSLCARPELSGTYHFCGDKALSWADFAHEILTEAKLGVDVVPISTSAYAAIARRPQNSRLCCHSLAVAFGIKPADWRTALPSVVRDLQAAAKVA